MFIAISRSSFIAFFRSYYSNYLPLACVDSSMFWNRVGTVSNHIHLELSNGKT